MKWKYMRLFFSILCCLFMALSIFISPISTIKADDFYPNDSMVTFGLYSYEEDKIVESQPDYYFDHIKYGMAHGIYNYLKKYNSNNANFPSEVSVVYQNLVDLFGADFFTSLSDYRWLLNIYAYNQGNIIFLMFNRADGYSVSPMSERTFNMNDTVTVELLPEGARNAYYVVDDGKIWSYAPYVIKSGLSVGNSNSYFNGGAYSTFETLSDVKGALSNLNTRSFTLIINTTSTFTFTLQSYMYNCVYSNSSVLRGFRAYELGYSFLHPIMVDFPIYDTGVESGYPVFQYRTAYDVTYISMNYNRLSNTFSRDMNLSPVILSSYGEINPPTPTPTFTPTPLPTWTPYPTATPFPPVNEIEGISQMMTLFTRKYEFNINGNVIGIRPLYFFVFTFLVGAIFKAIQGGDRN